jgi:transcriptional regulator with XRE-family HTH domain
VPSALVLFGRQLKKLRKSRGLSQEELTEMCNFQRHYIGRIERGDRVISFEYMITIAHALKVRPAQLYEQIPVPKRPARRGEYKGEQKSGYRTKPL